MDSWVRRVAVLSAVVWLALTAFIAVETLPTLWPVLPWFPWRLTALTVLLIQVPIPIVLLIVFGRKSHLRTPTAVPPPNERVGE
jgi:hypothetical protein